MPGTYAGGPAVPDRTLFAKQIRKLPHHPGDPQRVQVGGEQALFRSKHKCGNLATRPASRQPEGPLFARPLVTPTVDGIDAGSNQVLTACNPNPNLATCQAATYFVEVQLSSLSLGHSLAITYRAVADAIPDARIVVLTYPRLFNANVSPLEGTVKSTTDTLNATITGAEASVALSGKNIQVSGVTQEFTHHGIGASIPYISFDPPNPSVPANFHPNALGNSPGYFRALQNDRLLG